MKTSAVDSVCSTSALPQKPSTAYWVMQDVLNSIFMTVNLVVFPILTTMFFGWTLYALSQLQAFPHLFDFLLRYYPLAGAFFGGVFMRFSLDREWREKSMWYFFLAICALVFYAYYVYWDVISGKAFFSALLPYKLGAEVVNTIYFMPALGLFGIVFGRPFGMREGYSESE